MEAESGASGKLDGAELGSTGVVVSRVIMGCGNFGGLGSVRRTWGVMGNSEAEALELLDGARAAGITTFDTASTYGGGESERMLGRWLGERGLAGRVGVATKVGAPTQPGEQANLSPARIAEVATASRERLGVERIDLFLAHAPDRTTPIGSTLEAFAALVESGTVRAFGACNVSAAQLEHSLGEAERLGLPRYEWVQNAYSLLAPADDDVLRICAERGLGYTAHSPLCGGILTGKYAPGAAPLKGSRIAGRAGDYAGFLTVAALEGVQRLAAEAARRGVSTAALALAWVLSGETVTAAILGPSRPDQFGVVHEALGLHLDAGDRAQLRDLVAPAA